MNQSETEIEILAEKIARWARARSAEIERDRRLPDELVTRLRSSDGMKNFRKTGNGWYRKSVFFARQLRVNDDRAVARSSLVYGRVFDHLPQHLRSAERDQP